MNALNKIIAAGFTLELAGNELLIKPFSKLTPNQVAFLKSHKAEIVQELEQQQAGNGTQGLSHADKTKIEAWLSRIGETDQAMIDDVIDQCRTDAAAMAYFLKRACEVAR